jgi:hypothetical protein
MGGRRQCRTPATQAKPGDAHRPQVVGVALRMLGEGGAMLDQGALQALGPCLEVGREPVRPLVPAPVQHPLDALDGAHSVQAQEQVGVLPGPERLVPAADREHRLGRADQGVVGGEVAPPGAFQSVVASLRRRHRQQHPGAVAVAVDLLDAGEHGDRLGKRGSVGRPQRALEHVGDQLVVIVEEGHPAATGGGQPGVAGRADPGRAVPPLHDQPLVDTADPERLGRGVVHHDHLDGQQRLGQRTFDRPVHQGGSVAGCDDDGNLGVLQCHSQTTRGSADPRVEIA